MLVQAEAHRGGGRRSSVMVQDGNPNDPLPAVRDVRSLQVCGELPLPLIHPVLEPDLHLGLCQTQRRGQPRPLRAAQVTLGVKGGLQLKHLWLNTVRVFFLRVQPGSEPASKAHSASSFSSVKHPSPVFVSVSSLLSDTAGEARPHTEQHGSSELRLAFIPKNTFRNLGLKNSLG